MQQGRDTRDDYYLKNGSGHTANPAKSPDKRDEEEANAAPTTMTSLQRLHLKSNFRGKDDTIIWDEFRGGDEPAFIFIYEKYFPELYRYGYQFTTDKNLIEDCLQDFFIVLRQKRSRLGRLQKSIRTYLFISFRRRIMEYKRKTEKTIMANRQAFEFELPLEDQLISEDRIRLQKGRLEKGLNNLTRKQREIIYYFFYKNMSYQEVKEIMGVENVKTIRNALYRGLASLRALFKCM